MNTEATSKQEETSSSNEAHANNPLGDATIDKEEHSECSTTDSEDEDAEFADAVEELVQAAGLSEHFNKEANKTDDEISSCNNSSNPDSSKSLQNDTEQSKDSGVTSSNTSHTKPGDNTDNTVTIENLPDEEDDEVYEDKFVNSEENLIIDDDWLKERDANMTDEEKQEKKDEAQTLKETGNTLFKEGNYPAAVQSYTEALQTCPLSFPKERSIMYSNRAACKYKQAEHEEAILDCNKALELHPHYLKALMRRAELYEKIDKLDDALVDYQKSLELDPANHPARAACMRLPEQITERNETLKTEMMGKLKDLGNMILRPFGMSTENFNLQQDPSTGSYSVQFQQNASPNPPQQQNAPPNPPHQQNAPPNPPHQQNDPPNPPQQ